MKTKLIKNMIISFLKLFVAATPAYLLIVWVQLRGNSAASFSTSNDKYSVVFGFYLIFVLYWSTKNTVEFLKEAAKNKKSN